ncbi:hypothetical protein K432DRAFT_445131 [Lepidopterella palustris CBS 459.81]|uniref:TRAPP complex protein TRS85 n=1 Tax=Lepidopterella palustris CBS 459.81 TaxID=1314670 RepID=A0A8E2JCT4_9PEZI|nr:hypothetical protein K432DRAFT_445131 [Lepidopterella palustris CBS 459.81]
MTPPQDASPFKSPQYSDSEASIVLPKVRRSPSSSIASLPYRRSNPSLSTLFASTSALPTSHSSPGTATPTAHIVPGSVFSAGGRQNGTQSPANVSVGRADEPRNLILRAFVPHVAILASADTEDIVNAKGFTGGLLEMLRPFGESIPGKVTIRDSVGASRSWEDFGIRFTGMTDGLGLPSVPGGRSTEARPEGTNGYREGVRRSSHWSRTGGDISQVEEAVDRHLQYSELQSHDLVADYMNHKDIPSRSESSTSPFYTLYLRRLLSGFPITPHETFSHPVACIISISSRNPSPIEELRRLYNSTTTGDHRLPQWVNNEFLRYYVLVHDEEHSDITKSNQLFEQMKRHFGLHCHLLRLKSNQCIPSDDDSVRLPLCEWISAAEELAEIQKREAADDITDPTPYLFDSDVTAIRTFVRELATQSVVPWMERNTATWNEQILSRRRGISGRFMSLSKRWTPFGSNRASSPATGSSGSNYDSLQGFYRPDTPEALMRKLADYAFMLRDFKLALSTYDLLRTDFNNDKAWRHYAAAAEMSALATLMSTQPLSSKTRTESVDTWLEAASYSYMTRSSAPYYALRSLALGLELLKIRGSSAADDAARWATRILDSGVVGPVGYALFTERVSACYAARLGVGSMRLGSRRRKAAFWAVRAADAWLKLDKALQAEKNLDAATQLYKNVLIITADDMPLELPFSGMQLFVDELREAILGCRLVAKGFDDEGGGEDKLEVVSETLDRSPRVHRKSLIGGGTGPALGLEAGPSSPGGEEGFRDGGFE